MTIRISEVWNNDTPHKKTELAVIIIAPKKNPVLAVQNWISANRPDLQLADTITAHGYHAIEIESK